MKKKRQEDIKRLRKELTKVRCWMTGYHAGKGSQVGVFGGGIPGEDSLRQTIILFDEMLSEGDK